MGNSTSANISEDQEESSVTRQIERSSSRTLRDVSDVRDVKPPLVVPYFINPALNSIKQQIGTAMNEIEDNSRLQFREKNSRGPDILYITSGDGCSFSQYNCFGKQTCPPPTVTLGVGCRTHGTILHELLHSIGFKHEHQRPDRDKYITVYREKIKEDKWNNYRTLNASEFVWKVDRFPFDFSSIMMYGPTYFAKDDANPTMAARDKREWGVNRTNLSEIDKKKLKSL